jgi:four helix bundle protein
MMATGFRNLIVYKKAFALAMDIYRASKKFPVEELYSLTSQIRKSSRSVCSNIGEGYRKRQYDAHFVSKMSDADMENSETQVWLDFANECEYITGEIFINFNDRSEEIGRLLNNMIQNPGKYK